jgi:hypothetical protein
MIGKLDRHAVTRIVFIMLAACIVPACGSKALPADRSQCEDGSSDQFFFPEGWIRDRKKRPGSDQFVRDWYSRHLRTMSEPSLSCGEPPAEVYRFLWLRTWGHPIAVRLTGVTPGAPTPPTLSAVELDGAGGYEPGKIARRIDRKLTDAEWGELTSGLKAIDFWGLPTDIGEAGLDGAQWVLEGRRGRQYHVVNRWSPKTGPYRELALSLLKLAGLLPAGGGGKKNGIY